MDLTPLRKRLPFALALIFFLLAFARPGQRGIWAVIGFVFLIIGLRRSKAAPPRDGSGGA